MGINRIRVNLEGVFEVFCCALTFTQICEQISQMDTRAKVIVVNCETFLEVLHTLFKVFHLLVTHTDIVERI